MPAGPHGPGLAHAHPSAATSDVRAVREVRRVRFADGTWDVAEVRAQSPTRAAGGGC